MRANLDLYRIFQIVSRQKSISRAAKELYMTQSAVSQAILKLEKELKAQLFYRTAKGVILTAEGEMLQQYVASALHTLDIAEEKIIASQKLTSGQLRIGVGDTISRYFLMPYLEQFYTTYPGVKLKVLNGTTAEICQYIKDGLADVGICNLPITESKFIVKPCLEIEDIFVCGSKYLERLQQPLSLEAVLRHPLIFLERNSNSRHYIEQFFKAEGYTLSPEIELGSHDLVLEFAKINLGLACVTKQFSRNYLDSGDLHELKLETSIPRRHIGIIYSKYVPLAHASQIFIEMIDK